MDHRLPCKCADFHCLLERSGTVLSTRNDTKRVNEAVRRSNENCGAHKHTERAINIPAASSPLSTETNGQTVGIYFIFIMRQLVLLTELKIQQKRANVLARSNVRCVNVWRSSDAIFIEWKRPDQLTIESDNEQVRGTSLRSFTILLAAGIWGFRGIAPVKMATGP